MINQLSRRPAIPRKLKRKLAQLDLSSGSIWGKEKQFPEIKTFKKILEPELSEIQGNKCSFCGLELGETSAEQIEHFAPKGGDKRKKHPEFTFNTANLTLACSLCNGFEKKGNNDTVLVKNRDYISSTFNMVHPCLDDPLLHFDWNGVNITALSTKGTKSIKVFDLASTHMTDARAKLRNFQEVGELSQKEIDLIKRVREYGLQ